MVNGVHSRDVHPWVSRVVQKETVVGIHGEAGIVG